MESTQIMRITMPHREIDARYSLNFFRSLSGSLGFKESRGQDLTFRTLLLASMTNSYVGGTSQVTGVCGQTVRNHLKEKNADTLLQINHDMIATLRERGVLKKPLMVAMDWHDEMYYGNLETEGIIGTKNSRGSNYAYEYATASIVVRGLRFVVAVIPVKKRSIPNMVQAVLKIISELGIGIRVILMDGGFYSIDAINYLISSNIMFIMHAPKLVEACEGETDRLYITRSHKKRKRRAGNLPTGVNIWQGKDREKSIICIRHKQLSSPGVNTEDLQETLGHRDGIQDDPEIPCENHIKEIFHTTPILLPCNPSL